jgi:putative ABC transport system permease protein
VTLISPKARGIARAALRHLSRFRGHSTLLLLCGLLGVAGVAAAMSYAAEGRLKVVDQLRELGTNLLIVSPRRTARASSAASITTLVPRDYVAIRREIPEIAQSSAEVLGSFPVKAADLTKSNCSVVGVEPAFPTMESWPVREGEFFGERELRTAARVAVLGAAVARDLFGDQPASGQRVSINRVTFQVVGVLAERGQGLDSGNQDNEVYIPLTTASRRLMNVDYYSAIVLSVSRWEIMDDVAARVRDSLLRRHRPLGKQPEDFWVRNQKALIDTQLAAAARLQSYVAVVGWGGVLVSSLGMLAISWLRVAQRAVEIGTRRALGATAADVFWQLLLESLIISVLAATAGVASGWAVTLLLARLLHLPFYFDMRSACLLGILAPVLNLLFATLPAVRAARIDPIEALRSS